MMAVNGQSVVLAILCGALMLSGCSRTVDRVERAEPIGTPNVIDDERILTDTGLSSRVRVVSLRETTVSGDMLKVEADLDCITRSPQRFLYAFEWFDENGMQVSRPQWNRQTVQGGQRIVISGVANSPDAVDFRLHLMRAAD